MNRFIKPRLFIENVCQMLFSVDEKGDQRLIITFSEQEQLRHHESGLFIRVGVTCGAFVAVG